VPVGGTNRCVCVGVLDLPAKVSLLLAGGRRELICPYARLNDHLPPSFQFEAMRMCSLSPRMHHPHPERCRPHGQQLYQNRGHRARLGVQQQAQHHLPMLHGSIPLRAEHQLKPNTPPARPSPSGSELNRPNFVAFTHWQETPDCVPRSGSDFVVRVSVGAGVLALSRLGGQLERVWFVLMLRTGPNNDPASIYRLRVALKAPIRGTLRRGRVSIQARVEASSSCGPPVDSHAIPWDARGPGLLAWPWALEGLWPPPRESSVRVSDFSTCTAARRNRVAFNHRSDRHISTSPIDGRSPQRWNEPEKLLLGDGSAGPIGNPWSPFKDLALPRVGRGLVVQTSRPSR